MAILSVYKRLYIYTDYYTFYPSFSLFSKLTTYKSIDCHRHSFVTRLEMYYNSLILVNRM